MINIVESLTIPMVKKYLERSGWYVDGEWELPATRWSLRGNHYAQIILPDNAKLKDYKSAMVRVLEELVEVEGRSIDDIISAIQNKEHISIRVVAEDVSAGEIPIVDGANLFKGAKDLIKATAESIFKKTKTESKKVIIDNYLNSVTLGQTAVGSYAVNLYAPKISADDSVQGDLGGEISIMSEALIRSLNSLKSSLDEYSDDGDMAFLRISDKKLSAELCGALVDIGGEVGRYVEIKIGSITSQTPEGTVVFNEDYYPTINRALNYFKGEESDLFGVTIIGEITGLDRASDQSAGKVTVQTYIDRKPKKVSITLEAEEYEKAIQLHGDKGTAEFVGDIEMKARSAVMTNVLSFRKVGSEHFELESKNPKKS